MGTASRAREIPLPQTGYVCPLRSEAHPTGLPNLSPADAEKVASANAIYYNLAKFLVKCMDKGVYISVENPHRSYLRGIPAFKPVLARRFKDDFDACTHGSDRAKRTSFLTSMPELRALAILCDGTRGHKTLGHPSGRNFRDGEQGGVSVVAL